LYHYTLEQQQRQMKKAVEFVRTQAEAAAADQVRRTQELQSQLEDEREEGMRQRALIQEEAMKLQEERAAAAAAEAAAKENASMHANAAVHAAPPAAPWAAAAPAPAPAAAAAPAAAPVPAPAAIFGGAPISVPTHPMARPYSGMEHQQQQQHQQHHYHHQQQHQQLQQHQHPQQSFAPPHLAAAAAAPLAPLALVAQIESAAAAIANAGAAAAGATVAAAGAAQQQRSVEEELHACRRAIQLRNAESEHISRRMWTLQQEEADLHLRAAELQGRMLRMVLEVGLCIT
jgi:pyruvate dehydrogenase E2 component (dihydrolipoamide acetyltransferase)